MKKPSFKIGEVCLYFSKYEKIYCQSIIESSYTVNGKWEYIIKYDDGVSKHHFGACWSFERVRRKDLIKLK